MLLAEARATADKLRGQGEGQSIAIYADAYERDTSFYQYWRTLQAYKDAFAGGNSRLVMTPGDDFLKLLSHRPTPGDTAAPPSPAAPPAAAPAQ